MAPGVRRRRSSWTRSSSGRSSVGITISMAPDGSVQEARRSGVDVEPARVDGRAVAVAPVDRPLGGDEEADRRPSIRQALELGLHETGQVALAPVVGDHPDSGDARGGHIGTARHAEVGVEVTGEADELPGGRERSRARLGIDERRPPLVHLVGDRAEHGAVHDAGGGDELVVAQRAYFWLDHDPDATSAGPPGAWELSASAHAWRRSSYSAIDVALATLSDPTLPSSGRKATSSQAASVAELQPRSS